MWRWWPVAGRLRSGLSSATPSLHLARPSPWTTPSRCRWSSPKWALKSSRCTLCVPSTQPTWLTSLSRLSTPWHREARRPQPTTLPLPRCWRPSWSSWRTPRTGRASSAWTAPRGTRSPRTTASCRSTLHPIPFPRQGPTPSALWRSSGLGYPLRPLTCDVLQAWSGTRCPPPFASPPARPGAPGWTKTLGA